MHPGLAPDQHQQQTRLDQTKSLADQHQHRTQYQHRHRHKTSSRSSDTSTRPAAPDHHQQQDLEQHLGQFEPAEAVARPGAKNHPLGLKLYLGQSQSRSDSNSSWGFGNVALSRRTNVKKRISKFTLAPGCPPATDDVWLIAVQQQTGQNRPDHTSASNSTSTSRQDHTRQAADHTRPAPAAEPD